MKRAFTYLFSIIMAALVFYGGAGVNVVLYCCSQCCPAGVEALPEDKCGEMHGHTCSHRDCGENCRPANPAGHKHTGENCCSVKRISFDWKAHSFPESEINLSPVVFDLLPCQTVDLSDINRLTGEAGMMLPGEPPTVRPRDYLSEYNILLI